ncbi:hypothetical protein SpCBS45565_g04875 [Spizellomyces sp. 'palustris']|nr:hypothetical protein SpCBS45565_g04875 [Spizellomyces sp. 'palustris']
MAKATRKSKSTSASKSPVKVPDTRSLRKEARLHVQDCRSKRKPAIPIRAVSRDAADTEPGLVLRIDWFGEVQVRAVGNILVPPSRRESDSDSGTSVQSTVSSTGGEPSAAGFKRRNRSLNKNTEPAREPRELRTREAKGALCPTRAATSQGSVSSRDLKKH